MHRGDGAPVLAYSRAALSYGRRSLWSDLDLTVGRGEFVAVLGPNGAGKTSLLRTALGQQPLSDGTVRLLGEPVRRGSRSIGYIPQQRLMESGTPLRTRDLVMLGVTGHRFGLRSASRADRRRVDAILEQVGATAFADAPVAELSGGEQQRARVGQAIASEPALLLCDEPLISLDLKHQRTIVELIDGARQRDGTSVLFVTHDVNPILDVVDRVVYIAAGRFVIGSPDQVLRSNVLSDLYGTAVDVVRTMGRVVIVGSGDGRPHHFSAADDRTPSEVSS